MCRWRLAALKVFKRLEALKVFLWYYIHHLYSCLGCQAQAEL